MTSLPFRHRQNLDGTWDSICLRCYATAAHTHRQFLLEAAESQHRCDEMSWLYKESAGAGLRLTRPADRPAGRSGASDPRSNQPPHGVTMDRQTPHMWKLRARLVDQASGI